MPKLTVGGVEVKGVLEAHVHVVHNNPKAPDPVPVMQWKLKLRLQHADVLPKWAMAKQSVDRFKNCELVIKHHNDKIAHTWTLLNAYVHEYEEVEHPGTGGEAAGEGGYHLDLIIRGQIKEAGDYTGENVMTVKPGVEP
jgi:hypothetical protein